MKLTPEKLKALLDARAGLAVEVQQAEKLFELTDRQLAELEATAPIEDESALAQIGLLRVKVEFLPRRVAMRKSAMAAADATLATETVWFVSGTIRPRFVELRAKVVAKLTPALKKLYADAAGMEVALENSALVQELNAILQKAPERNGLSVPMCIRYGHELLAAYQQLEAFAGRL